MPEESLETLNYSAYYSNARESIDRPTWYTLHEQVSCIIYNWNLKLQSANKYKKINHMN